MLDHLKTWEHLFICLVESAIFTRNTGFCYKTLH